MLFFYLPRDLRKMQKLVAVFWIALPVALCCGCVEFEVLWAEASTETTPVMECTDEDPETPHLFYPDCDGDGVFGSIPTVACDMNVAKQTYDCLDGAPPDGGWSITEGTDCNDENESVSSNGIFYPDCDGDGVFSNLPTKACGPIGADLAFNCLDGTNPEGGWSQAPGNDCNDEDETGSSLTNWYRDCDGDGEYSPLATYACGELGADTAFDCSDGEDPDGGWSSIVGTDCKDDAGETSC